MEFRKVSRSKAKIRLGLSGVSGGGKTYSALLMAYGLVGNWEKIVIIDTENDSADLYEHLGPFNVIPLKAPFTPERYIAAIDKGEKEKMECIIIDSITHEWDGKGGCLEIIDALTKASTSKNSYTQWGVVTPRHNAFVERFLQSPCHMIATVRRKQDYEMIKDERGRLKVEKAGLKEITREGWEYELTTNLVLDVNHFATASKDRTGLFMDKDPFIPSIETGKLIREWCESGKALAPQEPAPEIKNVSQGTVPENKEQVEPEQITGAWRAKNEKIKDFAGGLKLCTDYKESLIANPLTAEMIIKTTLSFATKAEECRELYKTLKPLFEKDDNLRVFITNKGENLKNSTNNA